MSPKGIELDCQACKKAKSMTATSVPKFGGLVRVVGWIISIPSLLSVAIFGWSCVTLVAESEPGQEAGAGMAMFVAIILMAAAMVSGVIGYLLLGNRNVYKCRYCGFLLDRA